jgi:Family of unknown function (DUF6527)
MRVIRLLPMTSSTKMPLNGLKQIRHQFVEAMPLQIDEGVLYISKRFNTAIHKCCCGCGLEVVTPLNSAKWSLKDHGSSVSLFPSIGNWSFPCQSHYWLERNKVRWAALMSERMIRHVKERDRRDVEVGVNNEPQKLRFWRRVAYWLVGNR